MLCSIYSNEYKAFLHLLFLTTNGSKLYTNNSGRGTLSGFSGCGVAADIS